MDLKEIETEFKRACSHHGTARIKAIDEVINLTASSDLPDFLKKRVLNKCANAQLLTISALDFGADGDIY